MQRSTLGGKPSSAFVLKTIGRLLAAGLRPHISITITITSRNVDGVAEVVRFALERDLTFSFNFFRDNECASGFSDLQYEEQAMLDGLHGAFGVGDDYVVIDQHGKIAKCHMELGDTVGDIRTDDPVLAIRDDSRGIRNLLVEDKEGCRDCTWKSWCSGGCSAATFRATGRFDVRSPNCNIYRTIYPEAVRLEGLRILRYADR